MEATTINPCILSLNLQQCLYSTKLQASLYWSWLTGGHQLSGPITPLSFSVTAFRPRFIHQWSNVLFLLLYRKMKSSLSAVRVSPLLHVSATIFTKFLFLLLSLSRRCSSLSMTQPTCSLTFSIQNPSSRAFLSVGVMAAVGVFCVLLSVGSPCVGIPDLGSTTGKTGAGVLTQLAAFTPFWYSPLCNCVLVLVSECCTCKYTSSRFMWVKTRVHRALGFC